MVSKKVVKLLNEQIALEAESSQIYLAMAVWAEVNGWRGTAAFMRAQTGEEREHMFKLMKFLIEIGQLPAVTALPEPKAEYKDIEDVFETALKHEQSVTGAIYKLMTAGRENSDYAVTNLLQWFIGEQVEEEAAVRQALDVLAKAGKVSLYLADKEIGALRGQS